MRTVAKSLSVAANTLAILALVGMFVHIVTEMVLRNLFDSSTFVLDEFVGYAVSALTFLALGEAFRKGDLIQVRLVHDHMGARGRLALDVFGHLAALGAGLLIFAYVGKSMLRNYTRGTTSASIAEVPQWIPEALVLLGIGVFLLQVLACLLALRPGHVQTTGAE